MSTNKDLLKFGLFGAKMTTSRSTNSAKQTGIVSKFHATNNMPFVNIQKPISKIIKYESKND